MGGDNQVGELFNGHERRRPPVAPGDVGEDARATFQAGDLSHHLLGIERVDGLDPDRFRIGVKLLPSTNVRGVAGKQHGIPASVELDWDLRQKSRVSCTDSTGREIGVFQPRGRVVRGGDVLVANDGSLIRVIAAPQAVLRITHCTQHGSPFDLIRAAYHLGNRHVPIEVQPDHLKIEPDHVLADLLKAMHLIVNTVHEAFEPESGAYASHGHAAGAPQQAATHDHTHDHDHDHGHGHAP